jgi:signal transduction histidine kinase
MESVIQITPTPVAAPEPDRLDAAGMIVSLMAANARLDEALQQSRRELDEFRRKLGQDLHDGAQQGLIAIQIMAAMARERTDDGELAEAIATIGSVAAQAADDLRGLSQGIYPDVLVSLGAAEALCAVARTSPMAIRVMDEGVGRSSDAVEAAIYFCSLEAIQNAIKHAGGDARVSVTLRREPDGVVFEVADDGVGMALPVRGGGIGLRSMRDRVEAVGGRFELVSSPGLGTRVRGHIPAAP